MRHQIGTKIKYLFYQIMPWYLSMLHFFHPYFYRINQVKINNLFYKLIPLYLSMLHFYHYRIRPFIFYWIKDVELVYHQPLNILYNTMSNITLFYYLNIMLPRYRSGTYFVHQYNAKGERYFGFTGQIKDLKKYKRRLIEPQSWPKRKHLILSYKQNPVNFDLLKLDNYYHYSKLLENPVMKIENVFSFFETKCDDIRIMQMDPFASLPVSLSESISRLYE